MSHLSSELRLHKVRGVQSCSCETFCEQNAQKLEHLGGRISVVEERSTFVAHTNSHRFILHDDVWGAPGVRDVTAEVAAAMP